MLRDLPKELKMNILGYAPYRMKNTVASTIAIDDGALIREIEDMDPDFSLIALLEIYKKQPNFSLSHIMHLINEKERIMKEAPIVVALYDIIGGAFTFQKRQNFKADLLLRVYNLNDKQLVADQVKELFVGTDIFIDALVSLRHNRVLFSLNNYEDITRNLILWDRLMSYGDLLDVSVGDQYRSLRITMPDAE